MVRRFRDLLASLFPLGEGTLRNLERARAVLPAELSQRAEQLVKQRRATLTFRLFPYKVPSDLRGVSGKAISDEIPVLEAKDEAAAKEVAVINRQCEACVREAVMKALAPHAAELLSGAIAPNILGLERIKDALSLQLFAVEPVHILLIGDPGTGKTVMLQSAAELHAISTFGLGSGTSSAGLAVTVRGKEVLPGLLPQADNGLCCIDELNLMEKDDRAPLYSAMEKGFFTYDKGGNHFRFDARIRLLATANPTKTKFLGSDPESLREQMPFDAALLSRFHLVFIIRRPDKGEFLEITRKIIHEKKAGKTVDPALAKDYITYANAIEVRLPPELEDDVVSFVGQLKEREGEFATEITPRTVVGLLRLAKASARQGLRKEVMKSDLTRAKDILTSSLEAHLAQTPPGGISNR